jgi:acetyl esterase
MGLRSDVKAFVEMLASGAAESPADAGVEEGRAMYRGMIEMFERPIGELAVVKDFTIKARDGHAIPMRLYAANKPGGEAAPVILQYHGGGWVLGDLDTHAPVCAEMARQTGYTVVSVDYRLAPEHAFPTAYHDCLDAMLWLAGSPAEIGHKVEGIILAGDSAGGALAAACAQRAAERANSPVLALCSFYGALDMNAEGGSMAEFAQGYLLEAGGYDGMLTAYFPDPSHRASVEASPLNWDQWAKHPPALIYACEYDPLRDQSRAYAARLALAGVAVRYRESKGHIHGSVGLRQVMPSGHDDLIACCADLVSLVEEARILRAHG